MTRDECLELLAKSRKEESDNRVDNGTYDYKGGDCSSWTKEKELTGDKLTRAKQMVKYWMDNGFTKYQSIAAAAVAFQESGYVTTVTNYSGSGARGLFQWMPQYDKSRLEKAGYPPDTKIENLTFEQQMDFAMKLLKRDDEPYYKKIKSSSNLLEAVYAYTCYICYPAAGQNSNQPTKENAAYAAQRASGKLYMYTCPAFKIANFL